MACPKCGFSQPDGLKECMKCGIIFAKFPTVVPTNNRLPSSTLPSSMAALTALSITPGSGSHGPGIFDDLPCPHCANRLTTSVSHSTVAQQFGLVGMLLDYAFSGKYQCAEHGQIELKQFSEDIQRNIILRKVLLTSGAVLLFIACIALIVLL